MYALCEGMKWSHLPNAGGIYDQNPDLIEGFQVIMAARAKHENEEQAKRERKAGQRPRMAGRRR